MAAFGLKPDSPLEAPQLGIWPENWPPLQVFSRMTTQLNVGPMGGIVGLRYEALPFVMQQICQVPPADLPQVSEAVILMERHMVQILQKR